MNRIFALLCVFVVIATTLSAVESDASDADLGFALNPSLRQIILGPKHVSRIMQIRKIESFARSMPSAIGSDEGYVIIAVNLSLEGDFQLERAWHGTMCFVRGYSDRSWEHALELYLPSRFRFDDFRSMASEELDDFIAKHRKPNQPPQRNAGSRPSSDDPSASETPSSRGPRG